MKKRWAIAPAADEATVQALHAELGADYGALARVLAQRGLTSLEAIKRWLPGEPLAHVDLYTMADLRVAAERLASARALGNAYFSLGTTMWTERPPYPWANWLWSGAVGPCPPTSPTAMPKAMACPKWA